MTTKEDVTKILEETAPLAAETLRTSLRSGSGLKTDKAYLAALEILDRTGYGKKSEHTVKHEGIPSLPPAIIAGALTMLAKMFDQEESLKDVSETLTAVPCAPSKPNKPPNRCIEGVQEEHAVPTASREPSREPDIPFSISEEVGKPTEVPH